MNPPNDFQSRKRRRFATDPFSRSVLAWDRWTSAVEAAGVDDGPKGPPETGDLKSPVLWMAHAQALTEAAEVVRRKEPTFAHKPLILREMCDGQYCAVGLMPVGYS